MLSIQTHRRGAQRTFLLSPSYFKIKIFVKCGVYRLIDAVLIEIFLIILSYFKIKIIVKCRVYAGSQSDIWNYSVGVLVSISDIIMYVTYHIDDIVHHIFKQ